MGAKQVRGGHAHLPRLVGDGLKRVCGDSQHLAPAVPAEQHFNRLISTGSTTQPVVQAGLPATSLMRSSQCGPSRSSSLQAEMQDNAAVLSADPAGRPRDRLTTYSVSIVPSVLTYLAAD